MKLQCVLQKENHCFGLSTEMTCALVVKKVRPRLACLHLQQVALMLSLCKAVCAVVPRTDRAANPVAP